LNISDKIIMNNEKDLTIKEIFNLALKSHQNNILNDAQDYYYKVLKIDPNNLQAHYNLGLIFNKLEEYQKAINHYEKVIKINPKLAMTYNNLGVIFYELEKYHNAISYLEKGISIDPYYADAYNNLGLIFDKLEEYQKAVNHYEKAIEINPNHLLAHYNLGITFKNLKEFERSKSCYEKVLQIDPNNINVISALSALLENYQFNYKSEVEKNSFKKLIIFIFKQNNIEPNNIVKNALLVLLSNIDTINLLTIINSENSLLRSKITQNLLKDELLCLILQKSLLTDIFWEKLLNKLRCEILFNLEISNNDNFDDYLNFIISLGEQCWLNEYVYAKSEKEISFVKKLKDKIEKNKNINELEIAILSCYLPLNSSKNISDRLLGYKSSNILFNDLITIQIKEPLKEKELKKSIMSLDKIVDSVSKKVQSQYEENPYPRWRLINQVYPYNFFFYLNSEIKPNKIYNNNKFDNPNVLIAGCGTGRHPISSAKYKNANILSIDLSLSSLAYAKRKTEEFGYKNIGYLQADILQLNKLNKKFHIIEATGVLHHMKDPVTGIKVLLDILEPHGYLKIGLYSDLARKDVVTTKKFIKNKNYKDTNKDINICRQDILNQKNELLIQKVTTRADFYSTSSVRDLLFHVQEHRFTIPKISKVLEDLNLEFLGFLFPNPKTKKKYIECFPEDKKNILLDNWHKFEKNNPNTFKSMYQFWVRKI